MDIITLLILSAATWRISNLLSDTSQGGPFGLLYKLRSLVGVKYDEHSLPVVSPGSLAEGLTCVFCNSLWIGIAFAVLYCLFPVAAFYVGLPFALSAAAILIDRLETKNA